MASRPPKNSTEEVTIRNTDSINEALGISFGQPSTANSPILQEAVKLAQSLQISIKVTLKVPTVSTPPPNFAQFVEANPDWVNKVRDAMMKARQNFRNDLIKESLKTSVFSNLNTKINKLVEHAETRIRDSRIHGSMTQVDTASDKIEDLKKQYPAKQYPVLNKKIQEIESRIINLNNQFEDLQPNAVKTDSFKTNFKETLQRGPSDKALDSLEDYLQRIDKLKKEISDFENSNWKAELEKEVEKLKGIEFQTTKPTEAPTSESSLAGRIRHLSDVEQGVTQSGQAIPPSNKAKSASASADSHASTMTQFGEVTRARHGYALKLDATTTPTESPSSPEARKPSQPYKPG